VADLLHCAVPSRELVLRFGANKDWFEADRAAMAFASPELSVPDVVEIGDASTAHTPSQSAITASTSKICALTSHTPQAQCWRHCLFKVPKGPDLPVGWHWQPRRGDLTWRGWLSERLVDDPRQEVHGWRAALSAQSEVDRVYRASEARIPDLIEACPDRVVNGH
jgi:hypothetical protein